jgi:hypothetical protein
MWEEFKDSLHVNISYNPLDHRYNIIELLNQITSMSVDHLVLPGLALETS